MLRAVGGRKFGQRTPLPTSAFGPTPEVMEKMGDKLRARKLAKKAGLPVLPGTDKEIDDSQAEESDSRDRKTAAALGVAIAQALAANGFPDSGPSTPAPNTWRVAGRREQLLSRTLARGGWREPPSGLRLASSGSQLKSET